MKKPALIFGYGLLPLWAAIVVVYVGGRVSQSSEYWNVAPWLIVVSVPACAVTVLIAVITLSVHARVSGDKARRFRWAASSFLALNVVVGLIVGALWLRHESLQRELEIEKGLALEFVKKHDDVIRKAGARSSISLSSYTNSGDGLPVRYEFSIDAGDPGQSDPDSRYEFAIVGVSGPRGNREFSLECITHVPMGKRDSHKHPCRQ
jgi:hypothetical protein